MFKLNYVKPEEATGPVGEAYDLFPPQVGVPEPLQLYSASPHLLASAVNGLSHFMRHSSLEFPVLAAIRFLAAAEFCHDYCATLNEGMLRRAGLEDADLETLTGDLDTDLAGLPYEEHELALLRLVRQVVKAPETVTDADVQACRDAGWTDSDILEASYHAANMQVSNLLMAAFQQ